MRGVVIHRDSDNFVDPSDFFQSKEMDELEQSSDSFQSYEIPINRLKRKKEADSIESSKKKDQMNNEVGQNYQNVLNELEESEIDSQKFKKINEKTLKRDSLVEYGDIENEEQIDLDVDLVERKSNSRESLFQREITDHFVFFRKSIEVKKKSDKKKKIDNSLKKNDLIDVKILKNTSEKEIQVDFNDFKDQDQSSDKKFKIEANKLEKHRKSLKYKKNKDEPEKEAPIPKKIKQEKIQQQNVQRKNQEKVEISLKEKKEKEKKRKNVSISPKENKKIEFVDNSRKNDSRDFNIIKQTINSKPNKSEIIEIDSRKSDNSPPIVLNFNKNVKNEHKEDAKEISSSQTDRLLMLKERRNRKPMQMEMLRSVWLENSSKTDNKRENEEFKNVYKDDASRKKSVRQHSEENKDGQFSNKIATNPDLVIDSKKQKKDTSKKLTNYEEYKIEKKSMPKIYEKSLENKNFKEKDKKLIEPKYSKASPLNKPEENKTILTNQAQNRRKKQNLVISGVSAEESAEKQQKKVSPADISKGTKILISNEKVRSLNAKTLTSPKEKYNLQEPVYMNGVTSIMLEEDSKKALYRSVK